MKKTKVAPGIFWVEIPEGDLRIVCGCPADTVKHLAKQGMIVSTTRDGFTFETGPNAILLSDTPVQKGSFANLSEFPLLQMFYKQGMLIPGHPSNTGRRPLLIGLGDQVRAQADYFFRGNYGLSSEEEIAASGVPAEAAREMFRVKKWFAFGTIRATADLVETRALDADAVELAPGVVLHRKGFNRYEFLSEGQSIEVDLTLGPGERFEPSYRLPPRGVRREHFSVTHIGEGDGWDPARPCMGSIISHKGRFYLVDAGPHITFSLDALGIGAGDIEGIFHSHAHDDHFAGLTSLVRSERRMKYFAAPYVRATAQKKLGALMRFDEERFARFFEVHDLVPGEWNSVEGMEVRPLYSPHPVETTVFFFRAHAGAETRTYAHLADIPSFDVLGKLAEGRDGTGALSEPGRAAFAREALATVNLKKIDVGGGLIHGNAIDFASDRSEKVLLSHGIPSVPDPLKGVALTASFGDVDVLLPGGAAEYLLGTARSSLAACIPGLTAAEIEPMARGPVAEIAPGARVGGHHAGEAADVHLILRGTVEETDASSGESRRLSAGALLGVLPARPEQLAATTSHAVSEVTVLAIPAGTYREAVGRVGVAEALRRSAAIRGFLSLCPLFKGIRSETVLNGITTAMQERRLEPDRSPGRAEKPELCILADGEVDLMVGARLVETIGPGGFWGEERIVSSSPVICEPRAAGALTYFAIPAEILSSIPMVQWELQETFERRLRTFRAEFRFEWVEAFRVGIKELDDQHRRLFSLVNGLSEIIGKTGKIEGHEKEKKELLAFARLHFQSEEALME
ncbi:MAG TPA: MBL fold metallo-hydrolase, partial [Spirochaetia bacterium]|nr:MBL fold metallo-hydrolase [Spirochaetia bacterium]